MPALKVPPPTKKGVRTTAEQLYFQLKEFEEFRVPSFNTLYVQIPRPFSNNTFLAALGSTWEEAHEMIKPVLRLGIPENSIKNKLPHFREDYSPLQNTVRPRVQNLLKANVQFAERQAALSAEAAAEWRREKSARKDAKRAGSKPLPVPKQLQQLAQMFDEDPHGHHHHHHSHHHGLHIPQPTFYTSEMPLWVVPALNVGAYVFLFMH